MGVDRMVQSGIALVAVGDIPGAVVDLGCGDGLTSAFFARVLREFNIDKELLLYDAFPTMQLSTGGCQPLREFPVDHVVGMAQVESQFARFDLPAPKIVPGWFRDTLPNDLPEQIAFAHVDADLFDSVTLAMLYTYPRLSPGALCVIDDYGLGFLPCVKKAVDEFLKGKPELVNQTVSGIQAMFAKV
jgi:O-methyltransferase